MKTDFESIEKLILEQNPWRLTGKVPNYLTPSTERPLGKHIMEIHLKTHFKTPDYFRGQTGRQDNSYVSNGKTSSS